jgi:hypothetical protein
MLKKSKVRIFKKKSTEDVINEKAEFITNEIMILSLSNFEKSILVSLVVNKTIERIQQEKTVLMQRLEDLNHAEKILKKV